VATVWAAEYGDTVDDDPDHLAVGGESAGGNLAAAVSLLARDRGESFVDYQMLLYPVLDRRFDRSSYEAVGEEYNLTTATMQWYWDHYLDSDLDAANPYAVPLQARDLRGLPPATVLTCGYDPLCDEGDVYAKRLGGAGVDVRHIHCPDQIHAFLSFPEHVDRAVEMREEVADHLRTALGIRTVSADSRDATAASDE
jgi:acetyl esterase